jgi:hypothetical protein
MDKTLWSFLQHHGIEIPPIQRDYAQGRETGKIPRIRKKFINAILTALKNQEPLGLDFIYGKIYGVRNEEEFRRNKHAIESLLGSIKDYANTIDLSLTNFRLEEKCSAEGTLVYLVPFDGQQRLTTLFLIHWYFFSKLNMRDELQILMRFKYKTRKSSESFLHLLCNIGDLIFGEKLAEEIKNHEHFSNTWLDDPTVVSMLNVIDTIHEQAKLLSITECNEYCKRLIMDEIVHFDFLNLKNFNLADDLYVKMNARGKQLSDFENFKAWLFNRIENEARYTAEKWESKTLKFEIAWNDIFWNAKDENTFDIDEVYLNYFKLMYLIDLVKIIEVKGAKFVESDQSRLIEAILTNSDEFDFEQSFKTTFFSDLDKYFNILNLFAGFESILESQNFFFSKKGIKPSWQNIVKNYVDLSYIVSKQKALVDYTEDETSAFNSYRRIMNNLLNNTIIDNASLYKRAINEIDRITADVKVLAFKTYDWIEQLVYQTDSVFQEHQVKEERLKAVLLEKDELWENLILKAEAHNYFKGQLNFIFYLAGISLNPNEFTDDYFGSVYKTQFMNYLTKLHFLFTDNGLNRERFKENIFERALLSKADYLLDEAGYKCFGRDIGRDVSWKRFLLRDRNKEETNQGLLEVFSIPDFEFPQELFEKFIAAYTDDLPPWRKAFISNGRLFRSLGSQKYLRNISNHGWVIIKDHYKTYVGPHFELYSRDFYTKYLDGRKVIPPFTAYNYYPAPKNEASDVPCAYMNWGSEDFIYAMDIFGVNQNYRLRFFTRKGAITSAIAEVLIKHHFEEGNEDFICNYDNENEIYNGLIAVCNELDQLVISQPIENEVVENE